AQTCFEEAIKFFGSDIVRYIAVDGTEFQEERLDMLIFFAGAYAYGGSLEFKESEVVANPPSAESDFFGLSCGIPVSEENAAQVSGQLTEGGIETDSARVPQALMHFSEYYLAYSALKKDPSIKILLMDRTVSGDIAHLSWKMREHIEQGKIKLEKLKTSFGEVSKTDLELGRMLVENPELKLPSPRSQYLKFAAVQALIENGPMNVEEIIQKLNANADRKERLFNDLKTHFADCFTSIPGEINSKFVLKDSVKSYWNRLIEALEIVASQIFSPPPKSHPLNLKNDQGLDAWITPDDLDFLTLITIYALLREAWKRNLLILGIVKDSAASELVNTVLPVLKQAHLLEFENQIPPFNSDKMLLQTNSVVNSDLVKTPWSTFEYDVCFRTVSPVREKMLASGECEVRGAFKNVITSERMFVKAYFQLWSSENETSVRSHVFLYDRPCYPQYDLLPQPELILRNYDVAEETITPTLHFSDSSPISDLVLGILHSMGVEPIPEAIGHNYPLFLADKKAKWLEVEASKACVAAVELEIARSRLDQQVLFESKFRDYRQGVESDRRSRRRRKA
ncbi:MAG: hypothetical protein ACREBS_07925, partial [Nitrososphaerales archaeon]